MQEQKVYLEQSQLDVAEAMQENGDAENGSEALRKCIRAGSHELGYQNGLKKQTRLRHISRRFGDALALSSLFLLGLTLFAPLEIRLYIIAPMAASLGCYGLDRALQQHEPHVSRRLKRLFTFSRGNAR